MAINPQFGGIYRLTHTLPDGMTEDLPSVGPENLLPYRLAQSLHPGAVPEDHGTLWDNRRCDSHPFYIFRGGPALTAYRAGLATVDRQREQTRNPLLLNLLDHEAALVFARATLAAKPLDVTAIEQHPDHYPIERTAVASGSLTA